LRASTPAIVRALRRAPPRALARCFEIDDDRRRRVERVQPRAFRRASLAPGGARLGGGASLAVEAFDLG
jgi:hypothetical protein